MHLFDSFSGRVAADLFYVSATVGSTGRLLIIVTTDCPIATDSVGDYIRIVQLFDSFGRASTEPFYLSATVDSAGRLLSMVWTGWRDTPLRASYEWIGPEHNPRDVRTLKYHLVSGGLAFVQRSPDEIVAVIGRCDHGRTSDMGTVLNVTIPPSTPNGALADEIVLAGGVFAGRTAIPHASLPTVRYYALTRTDLGPPALTRVAFFTSSLHQMRRWTQMLGTTTAFMFAHGWQ